MSIYSTKEKLKSADEEIKRCMDLERHPDFEFTNSGQCFSSSELPQNTGSTSSDGAQESLSYIEEHKMYYDIYYNELTLFYHKTTIFTTIQLGLFTGVILKYDELSAYPWLMIASLLFLVMFSIIQLLVSIRGNHVNNAVIETISTYEKRHGFDFLSEFNMNVSKGNRIKTMNFPSVMIIWVNILFLLVWCIITFMFFSSLISIDFIVTDGTTFWGTKENIKFIIAPVLSCLFAVTMKIADLLDEHGLKLFKYADILFGVLWGIFGALLTLLDPVIANVILAMMTGFVIRKRLDYANHIIAFCIIQFTFFLFAELIKTTYFSFLIVIVVLGLVKDLKYKDSKKKIAVFFEKIYLYVPLIYALPALIYSIKYNNWLVFMAFFAYDFSYNVTRLIAKKKHWYQE